MQRGAQVEVCLRKIFFCFLVGDGSHALVEKFYPFGGNIHRNDFIMLCEQYGERKPHIPDAGDDDFHCLYTPLFCFGLLHADRIKRSCFRSGVN